MWHVNVEEGGNVEREKKKKRRRKKREEKKKNVLPQLFFFVCVDVRLPSTVHFPLALPSPTRVGAGWARTCTRASAIAANLMLIGLYGNYDIASDRLPTRCLAPRPLHV